MNNSSSNAVNLSKIKNKTFQFRHLIIIVFLVVLITMILVVDRENIFTVTGKTEAFSISLSDSPINHWNISNSLLMKDILESNNEEVLPVDSYYFPSKGTSARIQIVREKKPYLLIVLTNDIGSSIGEIETTDGIKKLADYAELKIPTANPIMLPFDGKVRMGEDVGVGVDKILLSGSVRVVEKQLFDDANYVSGEFQFDAGDRIELFLDKEETMI